MGSQRGLHLRPRQAASCWAWQADRGDAGFPVLLCEAAAIPGWACRAGRSASPGRPGRGEAARGPEEFSQGGKRLVSVQPQVHCRPLDRRPETRSSWYASSAERTREGPLHSPGALQACQGRQSLCAAGVRLAGPWATGAHQLRAPALRLGPSPAPAWPGPRPSGPPVPVTPAGSALFLRGPELALP